MLDSLAARHRTGDTNVVKQARTLERGSREEILAALAAAEPRGLDLSRIVARTGWLESEAREAGAKLAQAGRLRILSEQPFVMASAEAMTNVTQKLRETIERFHKTNPLLQGISKEELRGRAAASARPELFQAALNDLVVAKEVTVSGDIVQRAGREIALLPEEARAKEQIEKEFERAGLTVPHLAEVLAKLPVETKRARKLLQILLREKVLVKVSDDLVFHRRAIEQLRELLSRYRRERGERLPIPAFKELTGITRKYAIPLLEFLDRERVTRRVGDERVIL